MGVVVVVKVLLSLLGLLAAKLFLVAPRSLDELLERKRRSIDDLTPVNQEELDGLTSVIMAALDSQEWYQSQTFFNYTISIIFLLILFGIVSKS